MQHWGGNSLGAKNKVIAGDYINNSVITSLGIVTLMKGFKSIIEINKDTVDDYEVVDSETKKSAASAVGRGLAGGLLLGPVGLLAGLSAKKKGIYVMAIQFKDGKKSLLEINDKVYKAIITKLF